MNTKLGQKEKKNEKDLFKLMNNSDFGKSMKNVRKYRNDKLVTTERRGCYLESDLDCHTKTFFIDNLLAIEKRRI